MVKRIEIDIPKWKAIIVEGESLINDKNILLDGSNMQDIIRIIRNWNNEYVSNFIEEIYSIKIILDNGEDIFKFYNRFPKDFYKLNEYLEELYER